MTTLQGGLREACVVAIQDENRGDQLLQFVNNASFADVVLLVGPSRRTFYAHRLVLAAVSPYFHTMFTSGMKESRAEEIALPDIDDDMFELMLRYLYTGRVEVPSENVLALLLLADQFQCDNLYLKLVNEVERNLREIMKTPHFLHLPPQLVINLIKSDRLQIDELELFQGLAKWGEKQAELQFECERASNDSQDDAPPIEDEDKDVIFYSREEHERYKLERQNLKNQTRVNNTSEKVKELLKPLIEYVRFPLIDGRDLTAIVEPSGLVPYELLFEAYRFKTNPDMEQNKLLPNHRCIPRNSIICSFGGCKRKAIYACCNKRREGYETGCQYFSCELHTFHCSVNCRKAGRQCEGILHHCDRNKFFCGPILKFGSDRKSSF